MPLKKATCVALAGRREAVTKAQFKRAEERAVRSMKKVVEKSPETRRPSVTFKRHWAYGNAGIENETITLSQVKKTIKK